MRSAVDAAVAAQPALEVPVRMGIATGQAEPQQGDYLGKVLNRAARVTATGLKTSYRTLRGHGGPSHPHDRPSVWLRLGRSSPGTPRAR